MKKEILAIITISVIQGITIKKVCSLLRISVHRVRRWQRRVSLADAKPGPVNAPHALLCEEKDAILKLALDEKYVDDSHRVLTARGADLGLFYVSASAAYHVMRQSSLTVDRAGYCRKNGKRTAPERPDIDGPNQRWCWDITYCHTKVKGIFLYLYSLLDEYSRKVVAWRISWHINHREAMELLQEGLENEGLEDINVRLPDLINDRGTQMKAKAFMRMCKELGITQKFARPRTPNDNPFIESLFSIVKGYPRYPDSFVDDIEAITYFSAFFAFYNNSRYHGKIGFVTPIQKHTGADKMIIEKRNNGMLKARRMRLKVNRNKPGSQKVAFKVAVV